MIKFADKTGKWIINIIIIMIKRSCFIYSLASSLIEQCFTFTLLTKRSIKPIIHSLQTFIRSSKLISIRNFRRPT